MATLWDESDNIVMEIWDPRITEHLLELNIKRDRGRYVFKTGYRVPLFLGNAVLHVYKGYYITI